MANQDFQIPSEEEIAKLPRWARVAFAARSARSVLPLFLEWDSEGRHPSVRQAVEAAETAATNATVAATNDIMLGTRKAAKSAFDDRALPAARAANAAEIAAHVAAVCTTEAARTAVSISADAVEADDPGVYILCDFDLLQRLVAEEDWDDNTPVPPEVFGPLQPGR